MSCNGVTIGLVIAESTCLYGIRDHSFASVLHHHNAGVFLSYDMITCFFPYNRQSIYIKYDLGTESISSF